jgi:uncharacterized protein GlcG (DUF336 family)
MRSTPSNEVSGWATYWEEINLAVESRSHHDLRGWNSSKRGGKVVGAIGVSGGSGEQDQAVAEAGTAAFV